MAVLPSLTAAVQETLKRIRALAYGEPTE